MSGRRQREPKRAAVSESVRAGLESLAQGNEATIASMLDKDNSGDASAMADAMEEVMVVNALSAEMLLARFFDQDLLSLYSSKVLGKSGKGGAATLAARIAAEWAKASFSPKRAKVADPEEVLEDDWRTPLFYWRGTLSYDAGKQVLTWKGVWCASSGGLPSDEDFDASKNTFDLCTAPIDAESGLAKSEKLSLVALDASRFDFSEGFYLLDQGQGLESFSDNSHRCLAVKVGDAIVLGACGSTEFGRFVSAGTVDSNFTLTLARRYVDDEDKRAKWSAPKNVCDTIANVTHPWNDLPWKLPK